MTVHVLDTPLTLPTPDLTVVISRRTELKRTANTLSNFYLPVVKEALGSLLQELNQVDKEALYTLDGVPALLDTTAFADLFETLGLLRQDTENDQPEAIAQIVDEIDRLMLIPTTGLRDHLQSLDNALINFSAVSFGDVDSLIEPVEKELARIDKRIAAINAPLAKLLEQESANDTLIKAVEAAGFLDKLKPLLELLKNLADIDPKNPLVPSIKAGIDALAIILDLAGDVITYDHLLKLRGQLRDQIGGIRDSTRELQTQRSKEVENLAQLKLLQGMEPLKSGYAQEIGKLREALKRFIAYALNNKDTEQGAAHFIQHAGTLTTYMDELRRDWQS